MYVAIARKGCGYHSEKLEEPVGVQFRGGRTFRVRDGPMSQRKVRKNSKELTAETQRTLRLRREDGFFRAP